MIEVLHSEFDVLRSTFPIHELAFRSSIYNSHPGRHDWPATAGRHRWNFAAQNFLGVASPEFPSLFLRAAHFSHRHVDDDDCARLARLSTHRIESVARRCRGGCASAPMLFSRTWGGWVADRYPKRSVLVVTQICSMIQSLAMAALVWSGHVQPWQIIFLPSSAA